MVRKVTRPELQAIVRFPTAAAVVGLAVYLAYTAKIVEVDLPTAGDFATGSVPATALNEPLFDALNSAFLVLLLGVALLVFGLGWRFRSVGITGAVTGAAIGGLVGFKTGDEIALMVNRSSFNLLQSNGMIGFGLAVLWIGLVLVIPVIGLAGWGTGAIIRRRGSAGVNLGDRDDDARDPTR